MTLAALLLTAMEGLMAFVSPCILPMLPVYLAWLAREEGGAKIETEGARAKNPRRAAMLARTLCFTLGFTVVFVLMGISVTALGRALTANRVLLTRVGGAVIAAFGLCFILDINIPLLGRTFRLPVAPRAGKLLSAALFGVVFSLGWTPCLGAYLGAALTLAGRADTLLQGAALLLSFSLGLGIPYFLVALLADRLKPVTAFLTRHRRPISAASGAVLVVLGLSMAAGLFGRYAALFGAW